MRDKVSCGTLTAISTYCHPSIMKQSFRWIVVLLSGISAYAAVARNYGTLPQQGRCNVPRCRYAASCPAKSRSMAYPLTVRGGGGAEAFNVSNVMDSNSGNNEHDHQHQKQQQIINDQSSFTTLRKNKDSTIAPTNSMRQRNTSNDKPPPLLMRIFTFHKWRRPRPLHFTQSLNSYYDSTNIAPPSLLLLSEQEHIRILQSQLRSLREETQQVRVHLHRSNNRYIHQYSNLIIQQQQNIKKLNQINTTIQELELIRVDLMQQLLVKTQEFNSIQEELRIERNYTSGLKDQLGHAQHELQEQKIQQNLQLQQQQQQQLQLESTNNNNIKVSKEEQEQQEEEIKLMKQEMMKLQHSINDQIQLHEMRITQDAQSIIEDEREKANCAIEHEKEKMRLLVKALATPPRKKNHVDENDVLLEDDLKDRVSSSSSSSSSSSRRRNSSDYSGNRDVQVPRQRKTRNGTSGTNPIASTTTKRKNGTSSYTKKITGAQSLTSGRDKK